MNLYSKYIKRMLDIVLSIIAIVILSPILLIIAILVLINIGSPILFTQPRPGKNEAIFNLYKFRTMTDERDSKGDLLPDAERLSKFGKLLRASSLDELPELWNILKGDMSFIGPRPLAIQYLPYYNETERKRHLARPGLTGYSQINGRNNLEWSKRMELDLKYIENMSIAFDLHILINTVQKVLKQTDVNVRDTNPIKNFNVYKKIQTEGEIMVSHKRDEIGSDFELEAPIIGKGPSIYEQLISNSSYDYQFTFSGRSAIGKILDDIQKNRSINIAYLPSYSCLSMLQPFLDRNIRIEFYNVDVSGDNLEIDIKLDKKYDFFLFMQYFGFNTNEKEYQEAIRYYKKQNIPVVEDITHNLLTDKPFKFSPDYSFASLRKWFAIPSGAIAYKKQGNFKCKATLNSDIPASEMLSAMKLKADYLNNEIDDKKTYLKMIGNYKRSINRFDSNFTIDSYSMNYLKETSINYIKIKRKENAEFLFKNLTRTKHINLLINSYYSENETPLFVPLVISKEKRDSLRQYLIDNHVYLPVHWPEKFGQNVHLKDIELSLVCDQRYTIEDMKRMLELIDNWEKEQVL